MSASEARVSICGKFGLKPLTTENLLFYYAPVQGVVSYTALAVNVMNPSLIVRVFPKRDVTNILLANTLVGTGLYLYNKPHMQSLTKKEKILYSMFGAVTFSLSSVLIWAIIRNIVPKNLFLCTILGVGSGVALLKTGYGYVKHIDNVLQSTK